MSDPRIIEAHRTNFTVRDGDREFTAVVRGNFHETGDFPKVGDYVELSLIDEEQAVIEKVKNRSSVIKRKSGETDEEQIIATNVDLIFVVMGLDNDFNISRLERYLLLSAQSNIKPIIVLNKSDIAEELEAKLGTVNEVAGDVEVLVVSALTGLGLRELGDHISTGMTAVLLGSSGAGKSTITNWLLGESVQEVQSTRGADDRGRHTTTSRQLFSLSSGGYLIDTPGMRELGVIDVDTKDENEVFEKIEALSLECQFRNCDHEKSNGCKVIEALENGDLSDRELNNYNKLLREREYNENKDTSSKYKHREQVLKRQSQFNEAQKRKRLTGGA